MKTKKKARNIKTPAELKRKKDRELSGNIATELIVTAAAFERAEPSVRVFMPKAKGRVLKAYIDGYVLGFRAAHLGI